MGQKLSNVSGGSRKVKRKKVVRRKPVYSQPELPFEDQKAEVVATETTSASRKVRKKVRRKVRLRQQEDVKPEEEQDDQEAQVSETIHKAMQSLVMKGRAYKLSFGSLSVRKSLNNSERKAILKSDDDALTVHKNMYAEDDPFVRALRVEAHQVRNYFNALTHAHPEKATRLFVAKNPENVNWEDMSQEEAEEEMAKQLNVFHDAMHERIEQYQTGAVKQFIDNYDDILQRAEEYLKSHGSGLYDPTQYAAKGDLQQKLYVEFYPRPSVLPPEYSRIDPQMQARVAAHIREQMESSLAMQLNNVETALQESIQGLTERIEGINKNDSQRFYASRVESVIKAIADYEHTISAFGVDLGNNLSTSLTQLRQSLNAAGDDPHKVIGTLKASEQTRSVVLNGLQQSINQVGEAFKPIRRRITLE